MDNIIAGVLLFVIIIYMGLPFLLTRICGWGVFRKARRKRARRHIAFTFDDGPDPDYTPELLDLLRERGVKATFFVLGSKAEKYPELVKRMHEEGHQIGIHNYTHMPNWIMSPRNIRREHVERSADIIERITGERPTFYRPPWGILNIGDLFLLRKSYRVVLWSIIARDWKLDTGKRNLRKLLSERIEPGAVIVLHDSGDTFGADREAPKQMITVLREVLSETNQRGLKCVRTDELLKLEHAM
ncbi:polysaccharide deacetylase family protein [Paenibacillus alvei]|uniref:Polysaccharide deacetylase family protein n=1 Tax=Paenibacillus alvei TaxID=44250 RepID=A0AAP7DGC5_PAEAL|nr:polysaccharide deacetylase family protein [Paenibacillus alvei]MBG9737614.1 polysaccharide deacetylase [Paenibacillus alvei]MBG9747306.1 polysaccharide deacetylase [Paenibacillus alvei]MCY9581206.1 polysaccharide deacetylase family protein [Paenibacillus alvei]MCY9584504.1 polysaccharide deacetylase family protein [Paenibacillus alvei]NEZ40599.1 polysaccharide deacetylase family protein [Paenibacillus alvei]